MHFHAAESSCSSVTDGPRPNWGMPGNNHVLGFAHPSNRKVPRFIRGSYLGDVDRAAADHARASSQPPVRSRERASSMLSE
jgi:hypothetical protein